MLTGGGARACKFCLSLSARTLSSLQGLHVIPPSGADLYEQEQPGSIPETPQGFKHFLCSQIGCGSPIIPFCQLQPPGASFSHVPFVRDTRVLLEQAQCFSCEDIMGLKSLGSSDLPLDIPLAWILAGGTPTGQ